MPEHLKKVPKKLLQELQYFLEKSVQQVETSDFITRDPVQFMHAFQNKCDQELAGFFAAILAWGRRDIVNAKVENLLSRMDFKPCEFIQHFSESDFPKLRDFKHRTFNGDDLYWFVKILKSILSRHLTFERFWSHCYEKSAKNGRELIAVFKEEFFAMEPETPLRAKKHIADPEKGSSCKRLCMYLRWCLRQNSPVDIGCMSFMPVSALKLPLDVHTARQARILGLLGRKQNDWKSVLELTAVLQKLDPEDPAKYDFALFGIGADKLEIPESLIIN